MPRSSKPAEELSKSARWRRNHPEAARESMRRSNAKKGSARWYTKCPECDGKMSWGMELCRDCGNAHRNADTVELFAARCEQLVALWAAGLGRSEIAPILGMSPKHVSMLVSEARRAGYDLLYRRPDSIEMGRKLGNRDRKEVA